MKYLILCDGPNELEIVKILLENDLLLFDKDELLNLIPYHARQIDKSPAVQLALNIYPGEVTVLRIGDGLTEKLRIPNKYKDKIIAVEKYCTKPELEMLLIIAENLLDEYNKVKSAKKPKVFAKEHIQCGHQKYDNSTRFYELYFGRNPLLLAASIKEYKRKHGSHKKEERYLADLLK